MLQKPKTFIHDNKEMLINGAAVATVALSVPWIAYKLYKLTQRRKQITHSQTIATATNNLSNENNHTINSSHSHFAPPLPEHITLVPLSKCPTELIEHLLRTNVISNDAMVELAHGNVSTSTLWKLNKDTLLMLMRCNSANPNIVHVLGTIYTNKHDDIIPHLPHDIDDNIRLSNRSNASPPAHFTESVSCSITSKPTEINTVLLNDPANAFLDNAKEIFQLFLIPSSLTSSSTPRGQSSLPSHEFMNKENKANVIHKEVNQKGSLAQDHASRTPSISHYPRSGSTRTNTNEAEQQHQSSSFQSQHERRAMASRFYDLLHSFHTLSFNEQEKVMLPLARHFTHLMCEPIYITAIDVPSTSVDEVPNPLYVNSASVNNHDENVLPRVAMDDKTTEGESTSLHATQHHDHVSETALQESICLHAIADELLNTLSDDQAWNISHNSRSTQETRNKIHSVIALWQMCQSHLQKLHNEIKRLPDQLQQELQSKEHNATGLLENRLQRIENMEKEQEEQLNYNKNEEEKPINKAGDNIVNDQLTDNKQPPSVNMPMNASSPLNLFALMGAIRDIYTKLQDPALLHLPPPTRKLVLHELAEKARRTQSEVKTSIHALRASLPLQLPEETTQNKENSSQVSTNVSLAESLASLEVASEKIFDVIEQMEMITNAEEAAMKEQQQAKQMQHEQHEKHAIDNKKKQSTQLTSTKSESKDSSVSSSSSSSKNNEVSHKSHSTRESSVSHEAPRNLIQTNMIIGKYEYILNVLRSPEYINASMQEKLIMTQSIRQLLEELMNEVAKLPETQQVTLSRALLATNEMLKDFEARLVNAQTVNELPPSSSDDNRSKIEKTNLPEVTSVPLNKPKYTITPLPKDVKQVNSTNLHKQTDEQNKIEKDNQENERNEEEEEEEAIEVNPIVFAEKMYTTISSDEFTRLTNEEKKTMAEFLLERIQSAQALFQNECPALMTPEVNSLYTTLTSVLTRLASYSSLFDVLNKQLDWITAQLDSCGQMSISMSGRQEIANMLFDKIAQMKQLPLESSLTLEEKEQFNEKCESVTSRINEFSSTQTNNARNSTMTANISNNTPTPSSDDKTVEQEMQENDKDAVITLPDVVLGLQEIMNAIQSPEFILMPIEERRAMVSDWMNRLSLYITYCTENNDNHDEIHDILPLLQLMHARLKNFAEFVPEHLPNSTNQENTISDTNNKTTPFILAKSNANQATEKELSQKQEKEEEKQKDQVNTEQVQTTTFPTINNSKTITNNISKKTTTNNNKNEMMTAIAQRHALFAAIKEMTNELNESNNRARELYSFAHSHHLPPSVTQLQPNAETISRLHNLLSLISSFGELTETEEEIRDAFVNALHEMTTAMSVNMTGEQAALHKNNNTLESTEAALDVKHNNKDSSLVKNAKQTINNDNNTEKNNETVTVLNEERVANILLSISDQLRESANVPEQLLTEYEQLLNQVARTSTSANIIESVAAIKEQIKLQRLSNNPTSYDSESSSSTSSSDNNNEEQEEDNDDDDDDVIVVSANDQQEDENEKQEHGDESVTQKEQIVLSDTKDKDNKEVIEGVKSKAQSGNSVENDSTKMEEDDNAL